MKTIILKSMVKVYKACMVFICLLVLDCKLLEVKAQTHTPQHIRINPICGGYYEYLPEGYQAKGEAYPLIIYIHGWGHRGNGTTQLPLLLNTALPRYIEIGSFPKSFTVNGKTFRFIVISPQFSDWPGVDDVDAVMNYAVNTYNVDKSRIYLTGMSMGGGLSFYFPGISTTNSAKLAAIVPVCGSTQPTEALANNIAATNLPVWATHNQDDNYVPASFTDDFVTMINSNSPPPTPLAKRTLFPGTSHDAWSTTYHPGFKENGMNIYEWMLQYARTPGSALPVTLSDYRVAESAGEVRITWNTSWENNNHHFTLEHSADGTLFEPLAEIKAANDPDGSRYAYTDKKPYAGRNYYRLWQTDLDGKTVMLGVRELVIEPRQSDWLIYPNPARDHIIVGLNQLPAGAFTMSIVNAQGMPVRRFNYIKQAGFWQQRIPVAELPPGIYIIHIKGAQFESSRKLIKN